MKCKGGDGVMLFSILLILSVLITLLLVHFIRFPFEKRPIFLIVIVSGLTVLFTYITSQTLSLWLGVLFFFGIILSSTILLGKRKAWIVEKEVTGQAQTPKRSFQRVTKHFENPQGRSIYEEEKSPLYIPKIMMDDDYTLTEDSSFEDFLLNKQEAKIPKIENSQSDIDNIVELSTSEISIPLVEDEAIDEPVVPDYSYVTSLQEVAITEIDINSNLYEEKVERPEKDSEQIEDVEELSDKWMARRLDALLASEENFTQKVIHEPDQEELIRPNLEDLTTSIEVPKIEQDKSNDFEDISALYFNKQRSDKDGKKE